MIVDILTPEKKIFSGEASGVKLPGLLGDFEVLENHAPIIAALGAGKLRLSFKANNTPAQTYFIKGGFVEVLQNKVVVLAEGAETE